MTKAFVAFVLFLAIALCSASDETVPRAFFYSSMGAWNVRTDNIDSHEDKSSILVLSYDVVGRVEFDGQTLAIPRGHELGVNTKVTLETSVEFSNTTIAAEKTLTSDISVELSATSGKTEFSVGASEKTKDEAIQITSHNSTLIRGVARAKIYTVHRVDVSLKAPYANMLNDLQPCDTHFAECQRVADIVGGTHYVRSFTCGALVEYRLVCTKDELERHSTHEVTDAVHASVNNKYNASASSTNRDSVNNSRLHEQCQGRFCGVGSSTAVTINDAVANGPKTPAPLSVVLAPIGSLMTTNETAQANFNWFAEQVVLKNKANTDLAIIGDAYLPKCQQLLQQCTQVASQCASQPVVAAAEAELCRDPCPRQQCQQDYCLSYCVNSPIAASAVCANVSAQCVGARAFVGAAREAAGEGAISSELVRTIRNKAVAFAALLDAPTIGIGCECAATPRSNCAQAVKDARGDRGKATCPTRLYGVALPGALVSGGGVGWPTSADLRQLVLKAPVLVLPAPPVSPPPLDVDARSDSSARALTPSEIGLIVVGAVGAGLVIVLLVWCVVRRLQRHASHAGFVPVA